MKIRTIDVNAKEWFDKINGNSYFSGIITINYGMKDETELIMPAQYGYGDHYLQAAREKIIELVGSAPFISFGHKIPLWRYCNENNITLRSDKRACLKREVWNV